MPESLITDKEWLDLAWKHFQQHAQQRILYFNYFVIFSTILTTGVVTTFQANFQVHYLGVGLGLIQAFLSYIFWKIDERNRFLTKHAEETLKKIEASCPTDDYRLFTNEDIKTETQKQNDKSKSKLWRQITHSQSYRIIYITFFFVGVVGSAISSTFSFVQSESQPKQAAYEAIFIQVDSVGKFKKQMLQIDSLKSASIIVLDRLLLTEDSLKKLVEQINKPMPTLTLSH